MNFNELKQLSTLSEQELTAKLVALFKDIARCHNNGLGLAPFSWREVEIASDGNLHLNDVATCTLSDSVRMRNYEDYAAVIYCVVTRQKSAEAMKWDAGKKIKPAVLREIVLTICGRNEIELLVPKLEEPFKDEDTFFDGYVTVDEQEASAAFRKEEEYRRQREAEEHFEDVKRRKAGLSPYKKPWYQGIGVFVLIALCVGGYKMYKANEQRKYDEASERVHTQFQIRQARHRALRDATQRNPNLRLGRRSVQSDSVSVVNTTDTGTSDI